jgi:uncharacterized protein (TIGR02001 family)
MFKLKYATLALGAALMAAVGPALAEDAGPRFSFSLTGASDYIFRGVSQTDEKPAAFVAGRIDWKGFYAAIGAENVEFNNGTDAEYDLLAGWAGAIGGGFNLDVGLLRYGYVNAPSGVDLDTLEFKLGVSHAVGPATLGAAVFYTNDYFAADKKAWYTEINASVPFAAKWQLGGAVGHQAIDNSDADYSTWNLGVSYAATKHVTLDLRYHDTNSHKSGSIYGSRVVGTARLAF